MKDKQARETAEAANRDISKLNERIGQIQYIQDEMVYIEDYEIEIAEIWYEFDRMLFMMRLLNRGLKSSITKTKKQIKKQNNQPKQAYVNGEIVEI